MSQNSEELAEKLTVRKMKSVQETVLPTPPVQALCKRDESFNSQTKSTNVFGPLQLFGKSFLQTNSSVTPLRSRSQSEKNIKSSSSTLSQSSSVYPKGQELFVLPFPDEVITQYRPEKDNLIQRHYPRDRQQAKEKQYQRQRTMVAPYSIQLPLFRKLVHFNRASAWMISNAANKASVSAISATSATSAPSTPSTSSSSSSTASSLGAFELMPLQLPSFDEFLRGPELAQWSRDLDVAAPTDKTDSTSNRKVGTYRRNLRINVLQLTSLSSARDLDYELQVKVNQKAVAVRYGQMKKLAKKTSSSNLADDWLSLKVTGPFEISIILKTRPTRPYKVADYFARHGLWPLWRRQQILTATPSYHESSPSSLTSWSDFSSSLQAISSAPSLPSFITPFSSSSNKTITGYMDLSSGDDMELIENGQYRYRFCKLATNTATKTSRSPPSNDTNGSGLSDIEILIEFQWKSCQPSDRNIGSTSASCQAIHRDNPLKDKSFKYPWLKFDARSPTSPDIESEQDLLADKDAVVNAMAYTAGGDYLTFYLHGLVLPEWRRYLVLIQNNHLLLFSSEHKNKGPTYDLPLDCVTAVSKPTEEDQEYVCLNRQLGIVIQTDDRIAIAADDDRQRCVPLGSRIYCLADTTAGSLQFRRALTFIKTKYHHPTSSSS